MQLVEMGRKKDISSFVRGQVVAYKKEGYSQIDIAKKLKISRCAVQNSLKGDGTGRKNCKGSRKTTNRVDRMFKAIVLRDPGTSSARIQQLAADIGIKVSTRTIRSWLQKEFKLPARRSAKKPMVTEGQRKLRFSFCQRYMNHSSDWWKQVMFTDESTFQQVRNCGSNYVRPPLGQRFNPKFTIKTVKHPPSIMCWGGITARGRGPLTMIPKGQTVTAKSYIAILEEKLQQHMNISNAKIFLQDSAPSHTAKITTKWFSDNNITVLKDFPPNSPDLNVVENCWNFMKDKVSAHNPTSEKDLIRLLNAVWNTEITEEYCRKLVRSMPDRIRAVIKNKGLPCKY